VIALVRPFAAGALAILLGFGALAAQADTTRGTWNLYGEHNSLTLDMHWHSHDGHSNEDRDAPIDAQVLGIAAALASSGQHGSFTMHRDAGDFAFDGWFGNGQGSGTYTFASNESFFDALRKRGCDVQGIDRKMGFALVNVTLAYMDDLASNGYGHMPVHDYITFKALNIDGAYLRKLSEHGFKNLPPHKVITFKALGIL
jgi:hypothetical protein